MARHQHGSALALAAVFVLAGCQSTDQPPSADPVTEDVTIEEVPEFIPERVDGGSARENQPHIDYVIQTGHGGPATRIPGLDIVELLVESGYDKALMQLTPDMSLIELPADSTSLALRFGDDCVITQWGSDWYVSSVEPVVAGGQCLLGETVSLD
jgi:hypothetical protein